MVVMVLTWWCLVNVLSTRPNIRTCTGRTGSCNGRDALSRLWDAGGRIDAVCHETENRKPKTETDAHMLRRQLECYVGAVYNAYTTVLRSGTNVAIYVYYGTTQCDERGYSLYVYYRNGTTQ